MAVENPSWVFVLEKPPAFPGSAEEPPQPQSPGRFIQAVRNRFCSKTALNGTELNMVAHEHRRVEKKQRFVGTAPFFHFSGRCFQLFDYYPPEIGCLFLDWPRRSHSSLLNDVLVLPVLIFSWRNLPIEQSTRSIS